MNNHGHHLPLAREKKKNLTIGRVGKVEHEAEQPWLANLKDSISTYVANNWLPPTPLSRPKRSRLRAQEQPLSCPPNLNKVSALSIFLPAYLSLQQFACIERTRQLFHSPQILDNWGGILLGLSTSKSLGNAVEVMSAVNTQHTLLGTQQTIIHSPQKSTKFIIEYSCFIYSITLPFSNLVQCYLDTGTSLP